MTLSFLWLGLGLAAGVAGAAPGQGPGATPVVRLRRGLVITASVRVAPGVYRLAAPASLDSAVILIRGSDITVDFAGATLEGIAPEADPDLANGVALRIDGGRNIRIVNARIRGYRVGVLARGTASLSLIDNDLSYNWKPRLFSGIGHESLADWLSYHHNEHDEWLRFGAAAYLTDVHGGEIRGNRAEQGMNGVLLVRSDSLLVWNNGLSFNSGLGIGLYRSSDNTIVHNRVDFDVRGYSHGVYRRGQDSAALLMFEQCMRNVVAYNSMTHGGDGLFLWAGQHTMDTGEGGANDNLFAMNDFSFAPTNGIEATFSRNAFLGNRVEGADNGLWGGYSFSSLIAGNHFAGNRTGIAIEHGQDNVIRGNDFSGDSTAIRLWADSLAPSDWGYPKHRDTRGRDYLIAGNTFTGNRVAIRSANTHALTLGGNRFNGVDTTLAVRDTSAFTDTPGRRPPPDPPGIPRRIEGAIDVGSPLAARDRAAIVMTEWGPYDWRSPLIVPIDTVPGNSVRLRVLGPPGHWRVSGRNGIGHLSRSSGRTGDTVVVTPLPEAERDWTLALAYTGSATVSPRGARRPAGTPVAFGYRHFAPASWSVRFLRWDNDPDPRAGADAFIAALDAKTAVVVRAEPRLDYMWYRPAIAGVPGEKVAIEAQGTVDLPPGEYTLRTISDDGIRVWIDGSLAIDDWAPHESAVDSAPIAAGRHRIRVVHYQVDGWLELRVDILPGHQRSAGSPGPH